MYNLDLYQIIARVPAFLIAFAFHEWAHAVTADYFGDPTPRRMGRLSLNPFVHLDILGTLMIIFSYFGWAKPVLTNPAYYRGNKRLADLLVSAAGPAMNLLIAFAGVIAYQLVYYFTAAQGTSELVLKILEQIIVVNIYIGLFNLLPIPPLDGSHILADLLPEEWAAKFYAVQQYGMLILTLAIFSGMVNRVLGPLFNLIKNSYVSVSYFLLQLFGVG